MFAGAMAFAMALSLSSAAPNSGEERIWTGKNGATFRGVYAQSIENGGKILFLTSGGKTLTVAFGNLCEADQKIIEAFEGKPSGGSSEKPAYDPGKFKDLPLADRNLFPERKPEDFRGTDDESMVDALWISLLWWNAFEVMPIPKTGDFDRKAEWLHEELTRYISRKGSAASVEEAKEGLEKYFSRRLADIGACKVYTLGEAVLADPLYAKLKTDPSNPGMKGVMTPRILPGLTQGNDILILRLEMTYDSGKNYVECATFEKVEADGSFRMHMYGKRLTGKIVPIPRDKDAKGWQPEGRCEFAITNRDSLPKHYVEQGARFYADADTPGLVLKPYVYKTPGEPAPLPKD